MVREVLLVVLAFVAGLPLASGLGPGVVINEVELKPPGDAPLWVELYNGGEEDVEISGWSVLITSESWKGKLLVPQETVILAKGFYVQEGEPSWTNPVSGSVSLRNDEGIAVDSTHQITDLTRGDFAWSRYPDGNDTESIEDWIYVRSSRGSPNLPFEGVRTVTDFMF